MEIIRNSRQDKLTFIYPEKDGKSTEAPLHERSVCLQYIQFLTIYDTKLSSIVSGKVVTLFHDRSCDDREDFEAKCREVIALWMEM